MMSAVVSRELKQHYYLLWDSPWGCPACVKCDVTSLARLTYSCAAPSSLNCVVLKCCHVVFVVFFRAEAMFQIQDSLRNKKAAEGMALLRAAR